MFINHSLDHIHWTLSSTDNSAITDDTSYWHGHIVGSGVVLDSKVLSLQGGGHVILGRFSNTCPGNPSLCEDGYSVSFWVKQGGRCNGCYLAWGQGRGIFGGRAQARAGEAREKKAKV